MYLFSKNQIPGVVVRLHFTDRDSVTTLATLFRCESISNQNLPLNGHLEKHELLDKYSLTKGGQATLFIHAIFGLVP